MNLEISSYRNAISIYPFQETFIKILILIQENLATFHAMSSGCLYASSSFLKKIFWLYLTRILFQENDERQAFYTQDSHVVFLRGITYFLYQENIHNNQSLTYFLYQEIIQNIQPFTACINMFSLARKHIKYSIFNSCINMFSSPRKHIKYLLFYYMEQHVFFAKITYKNI